MSRGDTNPAAKADRLDVRPGDGPVHVGCEPTGGFCLTTGDPLHLLVLTTCVAVSLSVQGVFWGGYGNMPAAFAVWRVCLALGTGMELAGLLLWGTRRWRGCLFPVYPGEYLVVYYAMVSLTILPHAILGVSYSVYVGFNVFLKGLLAALVFGQAASRTKSTPWWLFFLTMILVCLEPLAYLSYTWLPGVWPLVKLFEVFHQTVLLHGVLPILLVGAVSWLDYRQGKRYPWTHWLGVAQMVWRGGVILLRMGLIG